MATFKLPELGEGLEEGEIVGWKVQEGDTIKADQPMVEVMTDKATVEVPSPSSGTVKKLFYKPGDVAKVGGPLIEIEAGASSGKSEKPAKEEEVTAKADAQPMKREATTGAPVNQPTARAAAAPAKDDGTPALASPAVRKFARESGIDLSRVSGSGDRGRVLRKDVETAVSVPATTTNRGGPILVAREERLPFIGVRRKIAEALTRSANTAVHFTHHDEADFTEIIKLKDEANKYAEKHHPGVKVTYLPFYIKAAIAGLKKFPILNSTLDEKTNEIVIKHYYHFGISVQTDVGLMVAVIRDCDRKDIFEIAKELKEVVDRARSGHASLQDLTGSTITITNPGGIGGLHATPIINYPESCILGMYQLKKRPVVRTVNGEDQIVARPMMYLNITCDHRVIDGAIAAEFMRDVCDYIENPGKMAFY